jgi:hypothetical protein
MTHQVKVSEIPHSDTPLFKEVIEKLISLVVVSRVKYRSRTGSHAHYIDTQRSEMRSQSRQGFVE